MPLPQPRHSPTQQGSSPVIRPSVNLGECQGREKGSLLYRGGSHCAAEQPLCSAVSGGPDCAITVIKKRKYANLPLCPAGHCSLKVS